MRTALVVKGRGFVEAWAAMQAQTLTCCEGVVLVVAAAEEAEVVVAVLVAFEVTGTYCCCLL